VDEDDRRARAALAIPDYALRELHFVLLPKRF
jgi:hypothetical protein